MLHKSIMEHRLDKGEHNGGLPPTERPKEGPEPDPSGPENCNFRDAVIVAALILAFGSLFAWFILVFE